MAMKKTNKNNNNLANIYYILNAAVASKVGLYEPYGPP